MNSINYVFQTICIGVIQTGDTVNPRNPGYILQRQTLGLFLGSFFYTILEIYINEEPMQKMGSPSFIFWSGGPLKLSCLEPV